MITGEQIILQAGIAWGLFMGSYDAGKEGECHLHQFSKRVWECSWKVNFTHALKKQLRGESFDVVKSSDVSYLWKLWRCG